MLKIAIGQPSTSIGTKSWSLAKFSFAKFHKSFLKNWTQRFIAKISNESGWKKYHTQNLLNYDDNFHATLILPNYKLEHPLYMIMNK
jgi:hypothetical protein